MSLRAALARCYVAQGRTGGSPANLASSQPLTTEMLAFQAGISGDQHVAGTGSFQHRRVVANADDH